VFYSFLLFMTGYPQHIGMKHTPNNINYCLKVINHGNQHDQSSQIGINANGFQARTKSNCE